MTSSCKCLETVFINLDGCYSISVRYLCWDSCYISARLDNSKTVCCGFQFEISRDLMVKLLTTLRIEVLSQCSLIVTGMKQKRILSYLTWAILGDGQGTISPGVVIETASSWIAPLTPHIVRVLTVWICLHVLSHLWRQIHIAVTHFRWVARAAGSAAGRLVTRHFRFRHVIVW